MRGERRAGPGRRGSGDVLRAPPEHAAGAPGFARRTAEVTVLRQCWRHLRYGRGRWRRNASRRRGVARAARSPARGRARGADPHRVALVLEGGGMRGVVSAGMTAALERLGLTPCFDLVVGASAGAINGAAFLAGAARAGRRRVLRPARLALVREPDEGRPAQAGDRRQADPRPRRRARRGRPREGAAQRGGAALRRRRRGDRARRPRSRACARRTSCGPRCWPPPACRGRAGSRSRSAGGATSTAGWRRRSRSREALEAGATHVLALQTRPFGVPRRSAIRAADWFIERHLGRLNPALVALYRRRVAEYEVLVEDIGRRSAEASGAPPHVLGHPAGGRHAVRRPARAARGRAGRGGGRRRAPRRDGAQHRHVAAGRARGVTRGPSSVSRSSGLARRPR